MTKSGLPSVISAELMSADHVPVIVTDPRQPDNPIVQCNDSFLELTGYSREDVVGRNCRFLAGPATEPDAQETIRKAIAHQRPAVVELTNYRKDGTPFVNSLMIAPIFGSDGDLVGFVGSQHRVPSEREEFVRGREERARRLSSSLSKRQKQVLSLLAQGKRTKQIAHQLGLAERTVKMHRSEMLKKLGVSSNAEAIRVAVRALL